MSTIKAYLHGRSQHYIKVAWAYYEGGLQDSTLLNLYITFLLYNISS